MKKGAKGKDSRVQDRISWRLDWAFKKAEQMDLKDLCLKKLAVETGLSRCYLSRNFPFLIGCSFEIYRENKRIAEAKKLLTETPMTLEQIAFSLGFARLESFTVNFEKATGYRPHSFRDYFRIHQKLPTIRKGAQKQNKKQ